MLLLPAIAVTLALVVGGVANTSRGPLFSKNRVLFAVVAVGTVTADVVAMLALAAGANLFLICNIFPSGVFMSCMAFADDVAVAFVVVVVVVDALLAGAPIRIC